MNFVNVEISEAGLEVTYSDGDPKHHPSVEIVVDPSGTKSYYRMVDKNEQKFSLYVGKLGDALAKALVKSGLFVPKGIRFCDFLLLLPSILIIQRSL